MHVSEIDTPAVLINLDTMERNLARMAAYCRERGLQLRPHTKTHKIPEIARMQIASGACGITVAKPGEARVMVDGGIRNILIAYPIVPESKARVVAELAREAEITVSLDSEEAAQSLSRAASQLGTQINILVELDVGFRRCGLVSTEASVALARKVLDLPAVRLRGLMFYPGHLMSPPDEQSGAIAAVNELLDRHYAAFAAAGIEVPVVSGGSTPTAYRSHDFHGVTEIRPGMYPFYDRNMLAVRAARLEDCAACVLVTVVSTAVAGRAIIDGGSKTFSSDGFKAGSEGGYGLILEDADAALIAMTEEHGHLDIERSRRRYCIGERLRLIPNHVCTTINMHDRVYGIRGDRVEQVWQVAARGKLQ